MLTSNYILDDAYASRTSWTTPLRNYKHTLKSPFFSIYSLLAAYFINFSLKLTFKPVISSIYTSLSLIISIICLPPYGSKMMFSTSYFLKPSLFPHLIRVSIVFEIPTSTSLISFLLNSYKKFYATCVGFLLNITSTSSMNTTHTSLNFFSISLFINLCVVIAELPPFPKSSLPITRCTSYKVFTILAFIEMTLQSYLERMVLAVRVFPAPGAPVSIRNRIPFF